MDCSVAFIDAALVQAGLTISDFDGDVYVIPSDQDGVLYITNILTQHDAIASIHLFSHGANSTLVLGNTVLNADAIARYQDTLQQWRSALSPEADFLIYGCDVVSDENGQAFIQQLANLTGADVAASTNTTGTINGADWQLEASTGTVETTFTQLNGASDISLAVITEDNPGTVHVTDDDDDAFDDNEGTRSYSSTGDYGDPFDNAPDTDIVEVPDSFYVTVGGNQYGPGYHGGVDSDMTGGDIRIYWNTSNDDDTWNGSDNGSGNLRFWNSGNPVDLDGIHVFGGNDTVYANGGDDLVYGGDGSDVLHGGDSNDELHGENDSDTLYGNSGSDTLYGGNDNDNLYGNEGTDTIYGEAGNDLIEGGADNEYISGGSGDDTIYGNAGDETIDGGDGNNTIYAGDGASPQSGTHTITSGSGIDVIYGGSGVDAITSGGSDDTITAHDGNDTVRTEGGNDLVYGGGGNDFITDDLSNGANASGSDRFYGEAGDDFLRGEDGNDILDGGDGNDTLESGNGNDILSGGAGNDVLIYGDVANGDTQVGGSIDPNSGANEVRIFNGTSWRVTSGQTTADGGTGLDVLKVVGQYRDYDITPTVLPSGQLQVTLTRRANPADRVVATNVEKIEFWDNYTVFPGEPQRRDLHIRNGEILPLRYQLNVLQHASEQLYDDAADLSADTSTQIFENGVSWNKNQIGQVEVQLKDWQNSANDYVIEGEDTDPGSKRDNYVLPNGLAIRYEIVVTGNFGPTEAEFLSDKLRFKRNNTETGRSLDKTGTGLEYVIETFVVVPPGESKAIINILPIVDEIQEGLETVEVRIVAADRVELPAPGSAATSAYFYQEGFLYTDLQAADSRRIEASNNAENNLQDGINKGYVLLPVAQGGDAVTVEIADSGLYQAGLRLVDEYGFEVTGELKLDWQNNPTKLYVGLTSRPTDNVTVTIAGQNYVFTNNRDTWNQLQEVSLTGYSDGQSVTVGINSSDAYYAALADRTLTLVDEPSVINVPEPVSVLIGNGNYLQLPGNLTLTGDYAIEFWMNPTDNQGTILQSDRGSLQLVNGTLEGTGIFAFTRYTTNVVEGEGWHKVSLISVGNEFKIFLDGEVAGRQTIASNTSVTIQSIGLANAATGFQGSVSSLHFWDQVLSQDNDVLVGTLKAQYNVDEGAGTTLRNQAPLATVGNAIASVTNLELPLWSPGLQLAEPGYQDILAGEADSFALVNRNFDFPKVSVSVPVDQARVAEGSDRFAAYELLLDKPAPQGGITVTFDLINTTLNDDPSLRPSVDSSDTWKAVDYLVKTKALIDGTAQDVTQAVEFGNNFTTSIYIPAGERKGTVYISAEDDQRTESNQAIQLQLQLVSNGDISHYQPHPTQNQGTVTLDDPDTLGVEILSLKSGFDYDQTQQRMVNTMTLEPAESAIVREADSDGLALRFNVDDFQWDTQGLQTAQVRITDPAGLEVSTTALDLTVDRRFGVITVNGNYAGKQLEGLITVGGVTSSFSLTLTPNQELTDAELVRLNPTAPNADALKTNFEKGHLLTSEQGGQVYPVRVRQSGWGEYVYVKLTSAPLGGAGKQVTVDLTATDSIVGTQEVVLSTPSLVFTADDWDQPRLVGIRGVNDDFNDGNQQGQITATVSTDPTKTTDTAYLLGGTSDRLLYLNVGQAAETVELSSEEVASLSRPENPAKPTYGFVKDPQSTNLTITEGESTQIAIATNPGGTAGELRGRFKVLETGVNNALVLNGQQDHINFNKALNLGNAFTVQMAFRWEGTSDQGQPIQLVKAQNGHGDLFLTSGGLLQAKFLDGQGQTVTIQASTPLNPQEEYAINLVSTGQTAKIYANGRLIGSGAISVTPIGTVSVEALFGSADVAQVDGFKGTAYGVRFWNRELQQDEIRKYSQDLLSPAPVQFVLNEATKQVSVKLNPELVTQAPTGNIELAFRRYTYTGGADPDVSLVNVTFNPGNWQNSLALPFNFGNVASLADAIDMITVQGTSSDPQVSDFLYNVGTAYDLDNLQQDNLLGEVILTNVNGLDLSADFTNLEAQQGAVFAGLATPLTLLDRTGNITNGTVKADLLGNQLTFTQLTNGTPSQSSVSGLRLGDRVYFRTPTMGTWDELRAYADSVGGELATVNEKALNTVLSSTFANGTPIIIGMQNAGVWETGEALSQDLYSWQTTWTPNAQQPNGVKVGSNGQWQALSASESGYGLVELQVPSRVWSQATNSHRQAEGFATQGDDFDRIEGVIVRKGQTAELPISGNRYVGDKVTLMAADFTGDQKPDLLVLSKQAGAQLFENTTGPDGVLKFAPASQSTLDTTVIGKNFNGSEARLVDADGDQDLDLVSSENGGLVVRLNQSTGAIAFENSEAVVPLLDQSTAVMGSGQPGAFVGFDFADINGDGNMDAALIDGNQKIQMYLGSSAFPLMQGLQAVPETENPFRNIALPPGVPLSLKFADVVGDGTPELYVYERNGGTNSYFRFFSADRDATTGALTYSDRTYADQLTARATLLGDVESLAFLNNKGSDAIFVSSNNGHIQFGSVTQKSSEITFDVTNPQVGAQAVIDLVSRQDGVVEGDERVTLQLLPTDDLALDNAMDRSVNVIIQDNDQAGVSLKFVSSNGQSAQVIASHTQSATNPDLTLVEGQQSAGFYVLSLDSQPQDSVNLTIRNSDSDRLQFERIHPLALTINGDGSLTIQSRLSNSQNDYNLSFRSSLLQGTPQRDGQGAYTIQLQSSIASQLQGAIAGKTTAQIRDSVTVQNLLRQIGIQVGGDDPTYRVGGGLNANQLLQERISVTPQEDLMLRVRPSSWNQKILLRPVVPDNLVDHSQDEHPSFVVGIDSTDSVYATLPALRATVPITDSDRAGVIINGLRDIREGVEGGEFQVSLASKPEGTVLITLQPGAVKGITPTETDASGNPILPPSRYVLVNTPMTWSEAQKYAWKLGGQLTSLNSEEEQQFLQDSFGAELSGQNLWIGLQKQDWQTWTDGSEVAYQNWASGQPDNLNGLQPYGYASSTDWQWHDGAADQALPFIVEIANPNDSAIALDKKYYGDEIQLKFNENNWNAPQIVTVRAKDDIYVRGETQSFVYSKVQSDDADYAGIDVDPVTVNIRDNDLPQISAYTVLDAAEPGTIGFFGLRLNTDQVKNPEGLRIYYQVKGWQTAPATQGEDYQNYVDLTPSGTNFITIAPGQDLANVVIFPIDDYIAEGFDVTFKPSSVNTAANTVTLLQHRLLEGSRVTFIPDGTGDLPDGIDGDAVYYVKLLAEDAIALYEDEGLTQLVDLTSAGTGVTRLLDATGKTAAEAQANPRRFEAVELELLPDPNGTAPGYKLAPIETKASVRIYDNEEVGFRFILPGQEVLDSKSPADKGYLTIAEHPNLDNNDEFASAAFLVRPLSDPGNTTEGAANWIALRFDPRWDQNNTQQLQLHMIDKPKFDDETGEAEITTAVYDNYGRKIQFYQVDPEAEEGSIPELTDELTLTVTEDNWAEPIVLKSAVFFDADGDNFWDEGEHRGVTLSDNSFFFWDDANENGVYDEGTEDADLSNFELGADLVNQTVTLADFDVDGDGVLTLFETNLRPEQQPGWRLVPELGFATGMVVQSGDDVSRVEIAGQNDISVGRWSSFAAFTSFPSLQLDPQANQNVPDVEIKLTAEDGVPTDTILPIDYAGDPYAANDLWKQNAIYFDSNNWARFQRVKLTALDDTKFDIDRILPLDMKVYEGEGTDGLYSKKFTNSPSPLVLTVKDRRLDNSTVTGSLDQGFTSLEESINNYRLPLIGSLSGKLPPFLSDFIRAFTESLDKERYITSPALVRALNDALSEVLDGTDVEVSLEYDAAEQTIALDLAFGQDYDLFDVSLDSDIGLPALGLETEGTLSSIFHFDLRVGLFINLLEGTFGIDISENNETHETKTGANADVFLDLNNFKATGNIAFLKAELTQIPLDDFVNGHKPQLTISLDEDPIFTPGETEQTVIVRAYDVDGDPVDLNTASPDDFASYVKDEDTWKYPIILEKLGYDDIDRVTVEFNGRTSEFRPNWRGEREIDGLKIDSQLIERDAHSFFQNYNAENDILDDLEKDTESESLLSKGDTHSEATAGIQFALLGKAANSVEVARKYEFEIEVDSGEQAIPTLYTGDLQEGSDNLQAFLDGDGPREGELVLALGGVENNSPIPSYFTVDLFRIADPLREPIPPTAVRDDDFFDGNRLIPVNFTLSTPTPDPEDPYPEDPRNPQRRVLTPGGGTNSYSFTEFNGFAIDFATENGSAELPPGTELVFRLRKTGVSDALPPGTMYYIEPFKEEKNIRQVVDYLEVSGEEPEAGATAPVIKVSNPRVEGEEQLPDLYLIQGDHVTLQSANGTPQTMVQLKNAITFALKGAPAAGSTEEPEDTFTITEVGTPIRDAEITQKEFSSAKLKESFDYTLGATIGAAFNLKTTVSGNTSFPSVSVDLGFAGKAELAKGEDFEPSLTIGLKDLGLDMGSFLTKFAKPVIDGVNEVIDPIKPFIKTLNTDVELMKTLGLSGLFDQDGNGQASILEIAITLASISRKLGSTQYAEFFETVVKVVDLIEAMDKVSKKLAKGDNLVLPLMDEYHLQLKPGGDEEEEGAGGQAGGEPADDKALPKSPTEKSTLEHQESAPATPGVDGLGDAAGESDNAAGDDMAQLAGKLNNLKGLKFPVLDDPVSLVNLLFGKDVNLVTYELPELKLEFEIEKKFYPFPPYPVYGKLAGKFEAVADLGFGFDTYGFSQWSDADFALKDSYKVFDGFFLMDWTGKSYTSNGEPDDKPELSATAEIEAGAGANLGPVSLYLGGGIGAEIALDLEDVGESRDDLGDSDGKVRGSEIIKGISNPLSLFELYGRLYAFLKALIELDVGFFTMPLYEQQWEFDLFKFQVGGASQSGAAVQSEVMGATVFFDTNFNLKFDPDEPWGVTLGDGSYNFSVDTAELDINGDGQLTLDDGQIVVIGGIDKVSGLPIVSPMIASPDSSIVSPLTTMATQMAIANGGDQAASSDKLKDFFNLPDALDFNTFHPIEAIRSGTLADAQLGLQVYKSHIILDTLIYNLARVAGGYEADGLSADLLINVVEFVANALADVVVIPGESFSDRLSDFTADVVQAYYQQEILPNLTGTALTEAQTESGTILQILSDVYADVAGEVTPNTSLDEIRQSYANLTPLKTALKTDIPSLLDQYQQTVITAADAIQQANQSITQVSNQAPTVDSAQINTAFTPYQGATVGAIFGNTLVDTDQGDSLYGIAIVNYVPQANLGNWAYYNPQTQQWTVLTESITPSNALVVQSAEQLRFIPRSGAAGQSTPPLTVRLIDASGQDPLQPLQTGDRLNLDPADPAAIAVGGTSPYSSQTIDLTVTIQIPSNSMTSPPILTTSTVDIENAVSVLEDSSSNPLTVPQGETVADLFGDYFAATDALYQTLGGIAISNYKVSPSQGQWEYSSDRTTWTVIPDVNRNSSETRHVLLSASTFLRFVPTANYAGAATALTVNLIDDRVAVTSGALVNITTEPNFANSFTGTLTYQTQVYAVNDAPTGSLSYTFSQPEAVRISDRRSPSSAELNPPAGQGDLYPSILTVQGLLGTVQKATVTLHGLSVTSANNLDIWLEGPQGQRIILISDAADSNGINNLTLSFADGFADALSLSPLQNNNTYRPTNNTVANDLDPAEFAGAQTSFGQFVGVDGKNLNGNWKLYIQDDTDSGTDSSNFGRLLNGWSLTFDRQDSGFNATNEDATASPQELTVEQLFGSQFSDRDRDLLKGIAIISNASTALQGAWQYFNGTAWTSLSTSLTETQAVLLNADTKLRFLPGLNFNKQPGSITARLIDSSFFNFTAGAIADARFQTSGGPFSQETISRTINILPLNDAPTIANGAQVVFPTALEDSTNDTQTVDTLFATAFQDAIDAGNNSQNAFIGIAIVQDFATLSGTRSQDQQFAYEKGHWEVYDIGQATWIQIPSDISATNAYLVPKANKIRFKPNANYNGEIPPLTVHLVDNGAGSAIGLGQRVNLVQVGIGGTTRYTATTLSMTGQIEAVNDFSPVAKDVATVVRITANGQDDGTPAPAKTVESLVSSRFSDAANGLADESDADQGAYSQHGIFADAGFWGIFIATVPATTIGIWQYSANGTSWTPVADWSAGNGLYLPKSYQLRFQQTTLGLIGDASALSVQLVDTSISDTTIGSSLKNGQGGAIAAIATATPTPNRIGEASPLSTNALTLGQTITPLMLTGQGGNDQLTGGDGDNTLDGQGGNDTLSGGLGNDTLIGNTGDDTLIGGDGDDIYYVDSNGDVIDETNATGVETVFSTAPNTILGANVENLTLEGTDNGNGTGNELDNILTGNSGNNTLNGEAGKDTLNGGAGNDILNGGADNDALNGGIGNDALNGGAGNDLMIGGDGNDTYSVDSSGDVVDEANTTGVDAVFSTLPSYTLGTNIENLTLEGTDNLNGMGNAIANTLTGNSGNNTLNGEAGADVINGGDGNDILNGGTENDTLAGGNGNDTYYVDSIGDTVNETNTSGIDLVFSTAPSFTLSQNVENLTLQGLGNFSATGNAIANTLTGNSGKNNLNGGAGADTLNGGDGDDSLVGGTENDLLAGGNGNDSYYVDSSADVVDETNTNGVDTVFSSALTFTLSVNVENLTLEGAGNFNGTGNAIANTLTGNSGNNTLNGEAGADVINGGEGNDSLNGGTGNDTLIGGNGNDSYYVDSSADVVNESNSSGVDTVFSLASSVTLSQNLENLTLEGTGDTSGIGNDLANTLTGNSGNNMLNGGAGADVMIGGSGNDTYYVDNLGDIVVEADADLAIGGTDLIITSVDYSLSPNLENLTLEGTALVGIGNESANTITGNAANNTLSGGGGGDQLFGGVGSDRLLGDAGNDLLIGGDNNDRLFGGDGNDRLQGEGGNDTLVGGLGRDVLVGGAGRDVFVLTKAKGRRSTADQILDFRDRTDRIGLTSGLKFKDLRLVGRGQSTLIFHNNDLLAKLNGVNTNQITQADVISIKV
ncbi:MAG: DUF4347 domain-containing protein [Drouetiella hepatica Uher 2000/2452]|jgi:Ca2+-binding RTX toxin-like protein|uniref:DUF4347 domain-containing protein n=1 Tax=Drouetiella hepatica Uher 2000/2452 TaxID=904376 RepID=A0A951QGA4_9CYAN|nr:DUF4347 domain-containing protein [Drouetiella hepatica Uher 2000/2452]